MLGVARGGPARAGVDPSEPECIGRQETVAQERQLNAPATEGGRCGAPVAPAGVIREEERPGARGDAVDAGQEYPPALIVAEPREPWLGRRAEIEGGTDDPRGGPGARPRRDPLDIQRRGIRVLGALEADKLLPGAGFLETVLGRERGAMPHVQEILGDTRCTEGRGRRRKVHIPGQKGAVHDDGRLGQPGCDRCGDAVPLAPVEPEVAAQVRRRGLVETPESLPFDRLTLADEGIKSQIKKSSSPNSVVIPKLGRQRISDDVMSSVIGFFSLFILSFGLLIIGLALTGLEFRTSVTAAWTAIANVRPAFGPEVGPTGAFDGFPTAAKWMLIFGMLIGRLEILSVFVLFTPAFWRS